MQKRKYNILFFFLLLCMVFHLAFSPLHIIKDLPLEGYYKPAEKVELNFSNYFSRKYQDSTEKNLNYDFGLFPGFTRIHHQIEYSFFDHVSVQDVHKGKNGYLMRYCKGCMSSSTFLTKDIEQFVNRYLVIRDSLKAAGKNIVWVIAPDKNSVYSEFLPDEAPHIDESIGFYSDLKTIFSEKKIDVIDFNEMALKEKEKYPFPVFYKGGIHWTRSYAARCFDSLCHYLSAKTRISIQNTIKDSIVKRPWGPDIDIERSANLLKPIDEGIVYSSSIISQSNAKDKKILIIGDSFCHAWIWNNWFKKCFDPGSEFWYYNREVNTINGIFKKNVDHKNARAEIAKFDTFVIVFSSANAEYLDYGFMKDFYN